MKKLNKTFAGTMAGTISVHPKGFAFVSPDDPKKYPEDIFIPKSLKGNAVDGDRVEVAVAAEQKAGKGPEGMVQAILERGKEELVGIVWIINPKGHYLLYVHSLGPSKAALVKKNKKATYQIGDRLILKVDDWGDEKSPATCTVTEKLGTIDEAWTDIPSAIRDFGIRKEFPKEVIEQVKKLPPEVDKKDIEGRENLTYLECVTIDPDTARDFDDALSLTEDEKGHFHLGVHIADVSHYVEEGTPLDEEAKKRSNSTYFPGQCAPMLPEELSNHLCSLKEQVTRLTLSVLIDLDEEGTVLNYRIVRGAIFSQKRFTYKEAKKVLDGELKSPHEKKLKRLEKLCLLLKKKRRERGSVDLALPEIVIKVNKKGEPTGHEVVEYDITHQLVEEFMLKANELVAQDFMKKNKKGIFRIHEPPGEDNLEAFYALARSLGFSLPNKPEVDDIQRLFEKAKGSPHAEQLSIAYIRSMKLAVYSENNVGHYGLSLENYCHFTSPIRRYSDLIIHRRLFEDSEEDLTLIAKSCSDKERVSFKAETSVVMLKKLRLLQKYQQEDPTRLHQAVVSKIKPFGVFFEVAPLQYEGFLHLSDLEDDYYVYNQQRELLVGQDTGKTYKMGSPLELLLEQVDLIMMETKWALPRQSKTKKKRSRSSSTKKKRWSKSRRRS